MPRTALIVEDSDSDDYGAPRHVIRAPSRNRSRSRQRSSPHRENIYVSGDLLSIPGGSSLSGRDRRGSSSGGKQPIVNVNIDEHRGRRGSSRHSGDSYEEDERYGRHRGSLTLRSHSRSPSSHSHYYDYETQKKLDKLKLYEDERELNRKEKELKAEYEMRQAKKEKEARDRSAERKRIQKEVEAEQAAKAEKERKAKEKEKADKERYLKEHAAEQAAKKEKAAKEKKEEDEKFQERLYKELMEAGYSKEHIESILKKKKEAGSSSMVPYGNRVIKVNKKYLHTDTLEYYKLPWEYDPVSLVCVSCSGCTADSATA